MLQVTMKMHSIFLGMFKEQELAEQVPQPVASANKAAIKAGKAVNAGFPLSVTSKVAFET